MHKCRHSFVAASFASNLYGCKKSDGLVLPSTQSAGVDKALRSNSKPTAVTFILTRGSITISGAIEA